MIAAAKLTDEQLEMLQQAEDRAIEKAQKGGTNTYIAEMHYITRSILCQEQSQMEAQIFNLKAKNTNGSPF